MRGQSPAASGNLDSRILHRLRELADKVRGLEQRVTFSTTSWRISEDDQGRLIATHPATGTVRVLADLQLPMNEPSEDGSTER